MNSQLNSKIGNLFKGKVTKSSTTFRTNKPNSPIVQLNVSIFITMNYAIFTSLTKVKNKPNSNPKQTQFKPKQIYPRMSLSGTQFLTNFGTPSCLGSLYINRMKRKHLKKDFPDFFEKLPVMILTGSGKYCKLLTLIFSCKNRIAMKQHFDTGFFEKIC